MEATTIALRVAPRPRAPPLLTSRLVVGQASVIAPAATDLAACRNACEADGANIETCCRLLIVLTVA